VSAIKLISAYFDDIAAFSGGTITVIIGLWHLDPEVIVGKIITTFILGFTGGIAGISAKYVFHKIFKKK
jgi:hypothetical protein